LIVLALQGQPITIAQRRPDPAPARHHPGKGKAGMEAKYPGRGRPQKTIPYFEDLLKT